MTKMEYEPPVDIEQLKAELSEGKSIIQYAKDHGYKLPMVYGVTSRYGLGPKKTWRQHG